jgi:LmbE family N-acetylglucosaminyl deacetylase
MIVGPTLVVAAHPDDEVLGAGGWMARFPGASIAIMSEGTLAPDALRHAEKLRMKRAATQRAAVRLQSTVVWEGHFKVLHLHLVGHPLVEAIEGVLRQVRPTTVLTHQPTDLNQDHRVVAEAVLVATRVYTDSGHTVQTVLGFTVDPVSAPSLSHTQGGEVFVTLTEDQLQQKLQACAEYETEMHAWPHPRSVEALEHLARWSGARVGRPAAEPYTWLWGCL